MSLGTVTKYHANFFAVPRTEFRLRIKAEFDLIEFLESTVSFQIMKPPKEAINLKESHYHFLMIGLLNGMMARYDVIHEIESGAGCVDTMIIPRALFCKSTQAIILE